MILSAATFIQGQARASLADHERELDARVSVLLYPRIRRKQDKLAMRRPPLRFAEDAR